jgi:hypothetical protein
MPQCVASAQQQLGKTIAEGAESALTFEQTSQIFSKL